MSLTLSVLYRSYYQMLFETEKCNINVRNNRKFSYGTINDFPDFLNSVILLVIFKSYFKLKSSTNSYYM